jgi:hypothetical protein
MLQRQLSHLNGSKFCYGQILASYIFCVWLRVVMHREHAHFHGFVQLLFVAYTIMLYNRIHKEG